MEGVIHEYKRHMKVVGYSKATVLAYTGHLRLFRQYLESKGIDDLKEITKNVITSYYEYIKDKNYLGYDPQTTSSGSKFGQNMTFFQYPKPRTFTLGLSLTL